LDFKKLLKKALKKVFIKIHADLAGLLEITQIGGENTPYP